MNEFVKKERKYKRSNFVTGLGFLIAGLAVFLIAAFLVNLEKDDASDWLSKPADSLAIRERFSASPPLSPEESLDKMEIVEGFEIRIVAAEPLVHAPVALNFDNSGRMWVVEMTGYMPDIAGTGEDLPTGKIVILEDQDDDGEADVRKVFLDSLVLPRAISFVDNGILIAEPPNLWFVEIVQDKPGKKVLVDAEYARGGNVEHQPNGLIHGMDNWIYNAKSSKRYKKNGDEWLIERTHFRGQWGISKDNYGRLFYNHNSANVLGDYFPPGIGATNRNQREVGGFNEYIVKDRRVFPTRPTPGINRGYRPGMLDPWLRLRNVTAACSPLVYRGALFGEEFQRNAFVAEPSANLVKRNIIEGEGYPVTGRQAYDQKEFLTSTDERFRPVSLYNGPDGALYIVDMYRGIIQHKTYLTDYLKDEIRRRELTKPLNCGRIYKIVPKNKEPEKVIIPKEPGALVKLLSHPNGWARDKAQQMLVEGEYRQVAPELRKFLKTPDKPVTLVHALWTLEGLGMLKSDDLLPLLEHPSWPVRMNALSAMPYVMTEQNFRKCLAALEDILVQNDTLSVPLVAFNLPVLAKFAPETADHLLHKMMRKFPQNEYVADAVISNLENQEAAFLRDVAAFDPDTNMVIHKALLEVLTDIRNAEMEKQASKLEKKFPKGYSLFKSTCVTCHGADGNGVKALAPPLKGSEWVTGGKDKLAAIVLFGLTGPISVKGKVYASPEISGDMPGIGSNTEVSDEELAEVLSYIRSAWGNDASEVTEADIAAVRKRYKGRKDFFTMEELKKL